MKTVEVGTNVKVHYTGTLTDGTEFDSSHKREEPISFKVGESLVLEAFEKAVVGMTEGQTKSVTLLPDEAYGPHDPAATQKVPRQAFGTEFEFEVGGTVQGNGPAGPFLAVIESVEEEHITLDMNHPLAGKELTFEIEMVEIEGGTDFATLKVAELKALAKEHGFKGYSTLKKSQLVELLNN